MYKKEDLINDLVSVKIRIYEINKYADTNSEYLIDDIGQLEIELPKIIRNLDKIICRLQKD
jgi:hypothetical protein